jgi:glycosyltransferase involved in cell wall biosynthesis
MPRREALRILKRSRLLVLTSLLEGGANVVSEALAIGIPVLSSRISGSLGMLGEDYPGYFEVGDTRGLCRLLDRAESDRAFYRTLKAHCRHKHWIARPHVERTAWRRLLSEFSLISK